LLPRVYYIGPITHLLPIFITRLYASAVLAVIVCLSVCPSQDNAHYFMKF